MAASRAQVQVQGARELRRTLKAAGMDLLDLKEAHRAAGGIVVKGATTRVPKASGKLSATIRAGAGATTATIRAGGARAPYAGPIHWGWPKRNIIAQPFLVDAAEATRQVWEAAYQAQVVQIVNRIRGK